MIGAGTQFAKETSLPNRTDVTRTGGKMEKQIYIFLDSSAGGGIESHVLVLARVLRKHCQVAVVFWQFYKKPHPLITQLSAEGIPVHNMQGKLGNIVLLLRSKKNAVLHSHGYKANIISRLMKICLPVDCVCTFHNGDVGQGLVRLYTWLDEFISPLSINIAVSAQIAARLSENCVYVPNTVEVNHEVHLSGDSSGPVAFVGRLEPVKRPDRFCKLAEEFPQNAFAIWGQGSLLCGLQQRQMANVSFNGFVDDMQQYWSKIDLLVICSEVEGLPMVALEAMACGVPVLTLPLGDLPKLVRHQINGLIADEPAHLTILLRQWFDMSSVQRLKMRQQARLTVQQSYSSDQQWSALRQIYQM